MSDLLTTQDMAEAAAAFKDVTDTFNKDTIIFNRVTTKYDEMSEDNKPTTIPMALKCRVTVLDEKNDVEEEGTEDKELIQASFYFPYLKGQSPTLVSGNRAVFANETDEFVWEGREYRVKVVSYGDTDFPATATTSVPVLCLVTMQIKRRNV